MQVWLAEQEHEQQRQAGLRARQQSLTRELAPDGLWPPLNRVEVRVVVPGEAGRRLAALAEELGWSAERVLAVLAEHVQANADGLVHVPAVAVTAAPPGLEADRKPPTPVYRERRQRQWSFQRERDERARDVYGDGYIDPTTDW
ncbi:hypothetical protein [Kitasatospora phosalacinea]|uniref:Uncharacterized protein n=1 Tax=Kitasatospora phosalacinea TaxID=2065 RepID=A0ABW6GXF9_9ACTN